MAALDQQLGFFDETTYGTTGTPTRFFEFNSEGISEAEMRTEGDPLRVGTFVKRSDRFTPYFGGASGTISMDVLSKGFGFFLKHMLGQSATTGPVETTAYTHTGTMADLLGRSFTAQIGRPFHPSGVVQSMTYKGGKVASWTVSNSVDANLLLELECDFQDADTTTALATAAYPTAMDPLTWAGGTITIGGAAYDVTEFSVSCNNNLATDRRFIRANTLKKEPTGGRREVTFSLASDFDTLTHRNRAHATARAGALAAITGTWNGPTLLGTTVYPQFAVSIPAARFDTWEGANGGPEGISQTLTGVGEYDGTSSAVTVTVKSADVTA